MLLFLLACPSVSEAPTGLERVEELGGKLVISRNTLLTGLSGLERVGDRLEISQNKSLSQSDAEAFAAGLEVAGEIEVSGNAD